MKLNALLLALAVAGGFAGTGVAQAATELTIDNWNITGGNTISATGAGNSNGPIARETTGGTSLPRGNLYVEVTTSAGSVFLGDSAPADSGTFITGANVTGWGYWSWTGGGNLSAYTGIAFDYVADLAGADVILAFFDGTTLIASAQTFDLFSTAGPPAFAPVSMAVDLATANAIDEIRLYVFSAGGSFEVDGLGTVNLGNAVAAGLDFGIRNLKLTGPNGNIPEPATLALFGLGLAGIGVLRRKKLAA